MSYVFARVTCNNVIVPPRLRRPRPNKTLRCWVTLLRISVTLAHCTFGYTAVVQLTMSI